MCFAKSMFLCCCMHQSPFVLHVCFIILFFSTPLFFSYSQFLSFAGGAQAPREFWYVRQFLDIAEGTLEPREKLFTAYGGKLETDSPFSSLV